MFRCIESGYNAFVQAQDYAHLYTHCLLIYAAVLCSSTQILTPVLDHMHLDYVSRPTLVDNLNAGATQQASCTCTHMGMTIISGTEHVLFP